MDRVKITVSISQGKSRTILNSRLPTPATDAQGSPISHGKIYLAKGSAQSNRASHSPTPRLETLLPTPHGPARLPASLWRASGVVAGSGLGDDGGRIFREEGVKAGLQKTFDGQHPCSLCRLAQETERAQTKSLPQPAPGTSRQFKISHDLSLLDTISLPPVQRNVTTLAEPRTAWLTSGRLRHAPPVQPPRLA